MKADIVIAGGGLAGIATAIELLDQNLSVILVDRDLESRFGGLAQWALGGLFYVDSPFQRKAGIKDSPEQAFRDWETTAEFGPEDHWPRKWAEQYVSRCTADVYEWLKPKGIKYIPSVQWVERGLLEPGNSVPRFHVTWGTGWALTKTLIHHLQNHPNRSNLQLFFQHKAEEILMHNGYASGLQILNEVSGERFEIQADQVVIAAGGMMGDVEVVKKNWYKDWGSPPEYMLSGSHLMANGEIHEIAARAGAVVTHLDKQWNYAAGVHHMDAEHPQHGLSLIPPKSVLWTNYQGKRLGPMPMVSGYDTRALVERICQEEKKYSWIVMNERIALKELGVSGSLYNDANREQRKWDFAKSILFGNKSLVETMKSRCQDMLVANSVSELVGKMNALTGTNDVDGSLLQKEIEQFDLHASRPASLHNDEQFRRIAHLRQYRGDKLRLVKRPQIMDPKGGPLIAIRSFILARKSLGGIQTDLGGRVLTESGEAIPGLYAVGEAAGFGGGGIHGLRALEGTFLGNCIFNARMAVRDLVGKRQQSVGAGQTLAG
ncbi:MAG: FAD-binding dehydrogenase [Bacteroidota bacterium]